MKIRTASFHIGGKSQVTGIWNDMPVKITTFKLPSVNMAEIRAQFICPAAPSFLQKWGSQLAGMPPAMPDQWPGGPADNDMSAGDVRPDGHAALSSSTITSDSWKRCENEHGGLPSTAFRRADISGATNHYSADASSFGPSTLIWARAQPWTEGQRSTRPSTSARRGQILPRRKVFRRNLCSMAASK